MKGYFLSGAIIVLLLIAGANFTGNENIRLAPLTDEEEQKIGEFWSSRIDGGESNLPAQWFDEPSDPIDGEVKIIKTRTDNSYEENYVADGNEDYSYGSYKEEWQDITCIDPYTGEYYELPMRTDDNGNEIPIIPIILKEIKYSSRNFGFSPYSDNGQSMYLRPNPSETMVARAATVKFYAPDDNLCLEGIDYIKSELMESYKLNDGRSITNTEINTKFGPIEYQFRGSIDEERRGKMTTDDIILEFKYIYYDGRFQSGEEKGYLLFSKEGTYGITFTEQLIFKRTLGWDEEVQSEWNADPIGLGHLNDNGFFTKYRKMHSWYASSNGLYDKAGFFNSPGNSDSNSESDPASDSDDTTSPDADNNDNTPSDENNNPAPETETDNNDNSPSQDETDSDKQEDTNIDNANTPAIDSSADLEDNTPQQNSQNIPSSNEEDNNPSDNNNIIANPGSDSNDNLNNADNSQGTTSDGDNNINSGNDATTNDDLENQEKVLPGFSTLDDLFGELTNYLSNLIDGLFT